MRTTIMLDDAVFQQLRQRAADSGQTLSEIINQALRQAFHVQPAPPPPRFRMVVFGGLEREHHEPADFARSIEEEDARGRGR